MGSRSRTPDPQVATPVAAPRTSKRRSHILARLGSMARSVIDWLRAGYPDEAPVTGYSPLIALNGPIALTPRQKERVVDELHDYPADTVDIEVAITKATDRLPTEIQIRTVARALHRSPSRH
jgi:hypothetical protein